MSECYVTAYYHKGPLGEWSFNGNAHPTNIERIQAASFELSIERNTRAVGFWRPKKG